MNKVDTEQRMRSTRASRRRVRPTQGADSMDADLAEMIEDNLPLVKHIVFQVAVHFPRHVDRDELARAGALGLVEAARRYDEDRGVPFERFAAQRIRGAILDAVRAADWARARFATSLASSKAQSSASLPSSAGFRTRKRCRKRLA